jgi:hypothetical protein
VIQTVTRKQPATCNPFPESRYAGGVTVGCLFLFSVSALFPSRNHGHATWGGPGRMSEQRCGIGGVLRYGIIMSGAHSARFACRFPDTSPYMGVRLALFGDHHHHSHGKGGEASIRQRAQGDVAAANRASGLELAYTHPSLLLASKTIEINQESNHTHIHCLMWCMPHAQASS